MESLPPKSEAALRKGFRRQTLAGPPWLEAVAAKASLMSAGGVATAPACVGLCAVALPATLCSLAALAPSCRPHTPTA